MVSIRSASSAIRQKLGVSSFLQGISALFASTVLAQVISLAVWPVLTRLYRPEEIGPLGLFMGLLTVMVTLASLRYEMAIPIAHSEAEAIDLLALCGLGLLATSLIVTLLALFTPEALLAQAGFVALAPYRLFVPIGFILLGLYAALSAFATREGAFGSIARTRLTQAFAGPASQVVLGVAGAGAGGLRSGFIMAQSAGILPLAQLARRRFRHVTHRLTLGGIIAVARRFRHFPLISTWGVLAEMIGGALALYLLIDMYYTPTALGLLLLTERATGRPLRMVVTSLTPVILREAGRSVHGDPQQMRRRFLQVSFRHSLFAASWLLAINLAASWLFPTLFGPQWADAVPYVRVLSVWYFFATVANSVGAIMQALERQWLTAMPQIAGTVLGIAAFVLVARQGYDGPTAVGAYCVCQALAALCRFGATIMAIEAAQTGRLAPR